MSCQNHKELIENNNLRKESNLRGHLDEKKTNTTNQTKNDKNALAEEEDKSKDDYQLNRALDLLKSISVYDTLKKAS